MVCFNKSILHVVVICAELVEPLPNAAGVYAVV